MTQKSFTLFRKSSNSEGLLLRISKNLSKKSLLKKFSSNVNCVLSTCKSKTRELERDTAQKQKKFNLFKKPLLANVELLASECLMIARKRI